MFKDGELASVRVASATDPKHNVLKSVLVATLLPLAAFTLQHFIWPLLSPYAWLLFFPTVLLAAWLGGFWSGIGATLLSTALVVWRFMPPEASFLVAEGKLLLSPAVFVLMGFAVSVFQERLQRANEQLRQAYRQDRFLADAGATLAAATLDYEETLTSVARLSVREFADLCIIDLIEESGEVRRLRVVSRDPSFAWACEILTNAPLDRNRPHLTEVTFKTQSATLMEQLSPEQVNTFAQGNPDRLRALRAIDPRSGIVVPLMAREHMLGMLAFVSARASRRFTTSDLKSAEALALRAALSIDNARLYRAAQRALLARDEVLGIVAHDLRNPLNAIVLHAEALKESARGDTDSWESVESIHRSAARMNRMIKDLLDIARLEAGRLEVARSRVSAERLLLDAIQAQKPVAAASGIELRLDAAQGLPEVWADRGRVLQVFDNLIGNALKFTARGGRITIGAAPAGNEVRFWVADTGVGINTDDVSHIFEPFWQACSSERRGAGLGLTITKQIIDMHGGHIWVQSAPGLGSTFFFALPAALATQRQTSFGSPSFREQEKPASAAH